MHKSHTLMFLTTYESHNYIYTWYEKNDTYAKCTRWHDHIGLHETFGCTLTNLVILSLKKNQWINAHDVRKMMHILNIQDDTITLG